MLVFSPSHDDRTLILRQFYFLVLFSLLVSGLGAQDRDFAGPSLTQAHVIPSYVAAPLSFEANQGQTDPSVQFLARGSGYSLFLTPGEVVLNLERQQSASQAEGSAPFDTLRMKLVGANARATVTGADPQPGVVSYFIGNDPAKWHAGIRTYGRVSYAQVYPGVDLVFYGNQRQLEYDFVVAPGADPGQIAWQIDGARPALDAEGNLVLTSANGPAGFKKPILYQLDGGKRIAVDGAFEVAGDRIGFRLGRYDHSRPLVIDPVLTYASYLGGSSTDWISPNPASGGWGLALGLAVDAEGSVYVTGETWSSDFPVKNPYQSSPYGTKQTRYPTAFVTKFSPDGSSLVYSTYLGGSQSNDYDLGTGIAVDSNGDAYVTGTTYSSDFPVTAGAYQTMCAPQPVVTSSGVVPGTACGIESSASAFVTRLNSNGTALVYSTFLGGTDTSNGDAIALDAAGRAYVSGIEEGYCRYADSGNLTGLYSYSCFPTTTGAILSAIDMEQGSSAGNAFISVFDPTGADLLYSTIFGDMTQDCWNTSTTCYPSTTTNAYGIAVDASGYFYLVGNTNTMSLPTTKGVVQPTSGPAFDTGNDYANPNRIWGWRGYVAKFYPAAGGGSSLAWATYLGGLTQNNTTDGLDSIAVDSDDNVYVTGATESTDYPVTKGAFQTSFSAITAAVTKLNSTATKIEWSTFLGGNSYQVQEAGPIQVDRSGNVYIAGTAQNWESLPWVNPVETNSTGNQEAFVAKLDPTGSKLLFSTPIGSAGVSSQAAAGFALDSEGNMYLAGNTGGGLVVTPGAFQQNYGGNNDGFVARIAAKGKVAVALAVSPSTAQFGETVTLTATVTQTQTYASAPTGTIALIAGTKTLATVALGSSGTAVYTTSSLAPGKYSLKAEYSGDSTYPPTAAVHSLTVAKIATATTLKAAPNPAFLKERVTFTAKVTAEAGSKLPTGLVTFQDGTKMLSEAWLDASGTASFSKSSLAIGSHSVTAVYRGNSSFAASTSKVVDLKIDPKAVTTTTLTASAASVAEGKSVTFTAKVKPASGGNVPTGTVAFFNGSKLLGNGTLNTAGKATLATSTLAVGSHSITAAYGGDGGDDSSVSTPLTVNVTAN
jgi:hypothetical protein